MDYIFASILRYHSKHLRKIITYDIVCQWWRHLLERLALLPEHIRPTVIEGTLQFAIPKLHIYSHKEVPCQTDFSLNLMPGAGRTDGEGIERTHSNTGPVCNSTKQMGPGARHDTLDCHWAHWNWQKIVGMGASLCEYMDSPPANNIQAGLGLLKKLTKAKLEMIEHAQLFERFSRQQAERVPAWLEMVTAWEADHTQPNPYRVPKSGKRYVYFNEV
jgi:Kyakuja-Dileera-Zisupton transposase